MLACTGLAGASLHVRPAFPGPGLQTCPAPATRLRRREDFFSKVGVGADDEGAMAGMHAFCSAFSGVLAEVQAFLAANGLDDPAKV